MRVKGNLSLGAGFRTCHCTNAATPAKTRSKELWNVHHNLVTSSVIGPGQSTGLMTLLIYIVQWPQIPGPAGTTSYKASLPYPSPSSSFSSSLLLFLSSPSPLYPVASSYLLTLSICLPPCLSLVHFLFFSTQSTIIIIILNCRAGPAHQA